MDANEKNNTSSKKTQWEIREEMLNYIENKYNMEFEVADVRYRSWAYKYETMWLYPEGGNPNDTFYLYRYTKEDGEVYYKDYYIRYSMRDDYQKYVSKFVEKYFDRFKCAVGFFGGGLNDNLDSRTSFELFKSYSDENICVSVDIFVPYNLDDKLKLNFENLSEELSKNIGKCLLRLYGFSESEYQTNIADKDGNYDGYYSLYELEKEWN